jgi:hypothetical protein
MKRFVVAIAMLTATTAFAGDEMSKLDFMLGDWKGEATVQMGPGRPETIVQTEKVQKKIGGEVLLIEGLGKRKLEDGTVGEVVHDALAVLSWDPKDKKYRFSAHVAGRGSTDTTLELTGPRSGIWRMETPHGKMRYTINVSDEGEWVEIGEFSRDGEKWMKFIEMRLRRQ